MVRTLLRNDANKVKRALHLLLMYATLLLSSTFLPASYLFGLNP